MASNITRRDLLNGIAIAAGGLALPALGKAQLPLMPRLYKPPERTIRQPLRACEAATRVPLRWPTI